MEPIKIYSYSGCGTCRKALKWLQEKHIAANVVAIRETPPTFAELESALASVGNLRKLLNTSGGDYKAMNMKDRLPELSQAQALQLLSENGNLVKRPFVIHAKGTLVGFDEEVWSVLL
jgi:arsenate reductase (glutaredoxin)